MPDAAPVTEAAPAATAPPAPAQAPVQTAGAASTSVLGGAPIAEVKPADGKPAEVKPEIKYDLKKPEGSMLPDNWIEKTVTLARERGLSAEQAQSVLEQESAVLANHEELRAQSEKALVEGWATEAKNDPEIGGAEFAKKVEYAKRVVDRFGTDAFRKAVTETGIGNHPELIRFCYRIGKLMAADQTVLGGSSPSDSRRKSPAEILYGSNG